MAQCPTCGSNVSDQADVCSDCGMDLKSATAQPPQGSSTSQSPPGSPLPPPRTPTVKEAGEQQRPQPAPAPGVTPGAPAPRPQGGLARLTLKRGGALTGEAFPIAENAVVGRFDPETGPVDVDLGQLPEAVYVSRHHAEIWRNGSGAWFVKDLGTSNGTFIRANGQAKFQRVAGEQAINNGDELAFGNARFEFHVGA